MGGLPEQFDPAGSLFAKREKLEGFNCLLPECPGLDCPTCAMFARQRFVRGRDKQALPGQLTLGLPEQLGGDGGREEAHGLLSSSLLLSSLELSDKKIYGP